MTTLSAPAVEAWRFFHVEVARVSPLSPSFVRLTFTGADLHEFADNGFDQRFKLLLPDAAGGYDSLPVGPDWYAGWRALPEERRNPIRTYTVRAVRPHLREVDIDMVLHGDTGPASRFAGGAQVGDRAVLLGPNRLYPEAHGGLEFRPPAGHLGPTLLVGDETAAPAVLSILAALPDRAHGEAVIEVPTPADIADVATPPGVRVTWLVRSGEQSALADTVRSAVGRLGPTGGHAQEVGPDPSPEEDPLWDVPEDARADGVYAWIAGECSMVTGLRRHLVRDLGVDRRSVAFMGYWRAGRPGG
jgi:NADPH-dependent ferric siderophore reductase